MEAEDERIMGEAGMTGGELTLYRTAVRARFFCTLVALGSAALTAWSLAVAVTTNGALFLPCAALSTWLCVRAVHGEALANSLAETCLLDDAALIALAMENANETR